MAEGHRLRHLQVREAGHDRIGVPVGLCDERALQRPHQHHDAVDFATQPQPQVGGDLVVARASGVQSLAGVADQVGQALFDVQMHVFEVEPPIELAALDLAADLRQPALDRGKVIRGDDLLLRQHRCVRQRAFDVDACQAPVEAHRGGVAQHEVRDRFLETAGPGAAFRA